MSDLTEFLSARIGEDKRRNRAYWHGLDCARLEDARAECDCGSQARVLVECEAKRSLVKLLQSDSRDPHNAVRREWADEILRTFATVYAEHPDFREEWRA